VTSAGVVKSMQQKLHRLNVRIGSRLQAMKDLGVQQPQLVRTKELLQLTEFEEQVHQPQTPNPKPHTLTHQSHVAAGHRVSCRQVHRRRQVRGRRGRALQVRVTCDYRDM